MLIPSIRFIFLAAFFLSGSFLRSQNPADMPLRQIIELAQDLIGKGDFAGASPMLDELEVRFEDEKDPAVEKILQQFGFVRGIGYLQSFAKSSNKEFIVKAASAFGFFAEKFPDDDKAVMAMQKRTDCLRSLQEWTEAARVIEALLDPEQPFRKQILKRSELLNLYYGKAQCYHIEQDWVKGEPAFRELLKFADAAKDEDKASYAVSCLTEMFVQNKRIDEVFPFLPRLSGDTPARYDLRLNVNLMQGAEQLAKEDRFVEASLFYALTMTTEEIVAYYSSRESRLKTERERLEQFVKLRGRGMPKRRLDILNDKINELAMKATSAQSHLKLAESTPSFTTVLRWRKADNFQATKRDWESFWAFYWLFNDFPEHNMSQNFIYAAFASANTVKFREKSIELGESYLKNKDWKKFRPDVTFIMCNAYREQADQARRLYTSLQSAVSSVDKDRAQKAREQAASYYERFFALCDDFLSIMPEHKYSKDFVNMMGSVYFGNRSFDALLEKFAGYENGEMNPRKGFVNREEFKNSPAMATAHYMSGLALLATGRFEEAKPMLSAVVGVNVQGLPLDDGSLDGYDDEEKDL